MRSCDPANRSPRADIASRVSSSQPPLILAWHCDSATRSRRVILLSPTRSRGARRREEQSNRGCGGPGDGHRSRRSPGERNAIGAQSCCCLASLERTFLTSSGHRPRLGQAQRPSSSPGNSLLASTSSAFCGGAQPSRLSLTDRQSYPSQPVYRRRIECVSMSTATDQDLGYDVYISYPQSDVEWATSLARDLTSRGIRCFVLDSNVAAGELWEEKASRALDSSRALVVIWSRNAPGAQGMLNEISAFSALARRQTATTGRLIIPVLLGDGDLGRAPDAVRSAQAVVVSNDAYVAGPDVKSADWDELVASIAQTVPRSSPTQATSNATVPQREPRALPTFSEGACRALTYAVHMLHDSQIGPARLHTAALLGALRASVDAGMRPTTGDVLKFILSHQPESRTPIDTIVAASAVAGLAAVGERVTAFMTVEELQRSSAGELLQEAIDVQQRVRASEVHLRHVLATGVRPDIPEAVLTELGVGMGDLRAVWRESIRRTRRNESQDGWDEILVREWGGGTLDHVDWYPDGPATEDRLSRRPLALMLAIRLRKLAQRDRERDKDAPGSFLILLDGRWGTGKTSILNFLRDELEKCERPWLVVTFNAWQHQRAGPAWWSLLTSLRDHVAGTRSGRWRLRLAEARHRGRVTGAPYAFAVVILLAVAVGLVLAVGPSKVASSKPADVAKGVTAILGAIGAVWAGALVAGRFLLWDSPRGARLFEQTTSNPMETLREHFAWLVRRSTRPIVFFVDDLDRCESEFVVELLNGIQTLIRDTGPHTNATKHPDAAKGSDRPGPFFVVAADGGWIRASYEEQHAKLAAAVSEPGRALGYLFLDKIFQMSVSVPPLSVAKQNAYLSDLLVGTQSDERQAQERDRVEEQIRVSANSADVRRAWQGASPEVRDQVAGAAVQRLSDEAIEKATEHELQKFSALMDRNPRRMKRFLNSYTADLVTLGLEQRFPDPDALALWTILRLRWPGVAEYLGEHPETVEDIGQGKGLPEGDVDPELRTLLELPELTRLLSFRPGGPLTTQFVERLTGAR